MHIYRNLSLITIATFSLVSCEEEPPPRPAPAPVEKKPAIKAEPQRSSVLFREDKNENQSSLTKGKKGEGGSLASPNGKKTMLDGVR